MIVPKFIIDQTIINDELKVLNNILDQQRQLKQTLFLYLQKISDGIYNATNPTDSNSLISCLNGINKSFENLKENINKVCELKKYLRDSLKEEKYDSVYFEKYNEEYLKLFNKISEDNIFYYSFMESVLKYMNIAFPEIEAPEGLENVPKEIPKSIISQNFSNESEEEKSLVEENAKEDTDDLIKDEIKNSKIEEKTLIVSEKNQNVVLPFIVSDLENCVTTNPQKYSSVQDIIDKEYTVSLSKYKNQAMSRFRETYNLARNKSNFSIFKSLSLANELFFNSNVDPTVITACKNITELYVYLSCLEENALDEFKCFKIVYDLA